MSASISYLCPDCNEIRLKFADELHHPDFVKYVFTCQNCGHNEERFVRLERIKPLTKKKLS